MNTAHRKSIWSPIVEDLAQPAYVNHTPPKGWIEDWNFRRTRDGKAYELKYWDGAVFHGQALYRDNNVLYKKGAPQICEELIQLSQPIKELPNSDYK